MDLNPRTIYSCRTNFGFFIGTFLFLYGTKKQTEEHVTNRCTFIYAGALKTITDKLQRVLNAAARVVSDTKKFDRGLSRLLHDKLHWLDVPERVTFKLGLMTYHCLHGQAPWYLADHIKPAIEVASQHRLRSANRHRLIVPRCRLNTYGRQAFPVVELAAR